MKSSSETLARESCLTPNGPSDRATGPLALALSQATTWNLWKLAALSLPLANTLYQSA